MNYSIKDFIESESIKSVTFSPNGKKIAYLSNRSGSYQIYLIPSKGGQSKQLTFLKDQIYFAIFSPTKEEIIFGKSNNGDEKIQLYLFSIKTKKIINLTKNSKVKHNFGNWSSDGKYITYSKNQRSEKDFDVYILNIKNGKEECIYNSGGNCYPNSFSPQQNFITIQKRYSNLKTETLLFSFKNKSIKSIIHPKADSYYGGAYWLPDESAFYFINNTTKNFLGLSLYKISSSEWKYVYTPKFDVEGVRVSHDGRFLTTIINKNGYRIINLRKTSDMSEIILNDLTKLEMVYSVNFSKDSNNLAMIIGDSVNVSNLYIYSIKNKKIKKLTNSIQKVSSEQLSKPKLSHFKSFDNLKIPYFIYVPNFKLKKIPVIINIHGGPEAQYRPAFNSFIQYLVYKGYAIIAPNIRGSSGYGKKYMSLDDIEKRHNAIKDIEYLHKYIKSNKKLDHNNIILIGSSYGGYMVLASLVFYSKLWAGGVSLSGISNLETFLKNTAPHRLINREIEYGSLKNHKKLLKELSPINYIKNIKAPLLLIHGKNDPRVSLNEAEQIKNKLLKLKKQVKLITYKNEGHSLSKLKNKIDAYNKIESFLKNTLTNK